MNVNLGERVLSVVLCLALIAFTTPIDAGAMFFQDIFYLCTKTVCFDFKPFFNGHDVRLKDDLVKWLKLNHDNWRNKS